MSLIVALLLSLLIPVPKPPTEVSVPEAIVFYVEGDNESEMMMMVQTMGLTIGETQTFDFPNPVKVYHLLFRVDVENEKKESRFEYVDYNSQQRGYFSDLP